MIKKIIKIILQILNIFFIILTLGLIAISIFKKEWIELFIEWMKGTIDGLGYWNYLIAFLSSLIEAFPVLGGFLPGTNILLLVGGFFGHNNVLNFIYLIIISSIGAIIGNFIGYIIGKYFGKEIIKKYGLYIGVGQTELKYLEKSVHKWGLWGIILGKFHSLTRTFIPFVAGTSGMKSEKFMIYNTLGSIIRSSTTVIMGVFFVKYYKFILTYAGYIFLGILVITGLYIYKYKKVAFMKYMEEKNAEIEAASK